MSLDIINPTFFDRLKSLVRARDGRLTRELLRAPGRFGLGQVPVGKKPDATTSMVCGYCSTGCSLNIHMREGEAINLTPATEYPVNLGMACPKGWEALTVLGAEDRATTPLLRDPDGRRRAVDWHEAMTTMTSRIRDVQARHGAESMAFLSTGQIPTEEMALLGSLAKFGMGMVHGDGNTRQCMATAVVAYKQAFGFDAPPFTYQDLEESDCIVLIGSNLCIAHPIMWERVMRNRHKPEIIVVDPRRTETAMSATLYLPIRPKSDLVFLYGLANILISRGWINRSYIDTHTKGFDEFAAFVRRFPPGGVGYETGLGAEALEDVAERIHRGRRVSFWWTMGVNQSHEGVRTAQAIINIALMTGNMGRPGTGANSVTGQCNAMGSRLFSNTSSLLGGREFGNAEHRAEVARILDIEPERIPSRGSWAYDEIIDGIESGKVRGLWVIATNPAHSWINQGRLRELLGRLDFLVVQDIYHSTETAQAADLLLPAAAWGEKEGTFINSERRIGLIKKVKRSPGLALSDFHIFKLVAHYFGCDAMFEAWSSPEAVFQILKRLSAGRPCDITGVADYRKLDEAGGIQWPFPSHKPDTSPQRRLFEDGRFFHEDGRARFHFENPRPLPEPVNDDYPLQLLTGRGSASQWHTQTRTAKSDVLRKLYPREAYLEISPADARRYGIAADSMVLVESRRGWVQARAFVVPTLSPGCVFLPMHDDATNQLTFPAFDPYSRQPSYKACAVRVRRAGKDEDIRRTPTDQHGHTGKPPSQSPNIEPRVNGYRVSHSQSLTFKYRGETS
ncbi:molybdopterin oxidoreductase family protein [Singulisphaera sp. PoT]|uniref:molybdopterin oxidoreductase family protein n=1 Tax=Singulisphaera sp. PoT TaxID=3411797 RepID=UPI003BF4950B